MCGLTCARKSCIFASLRVSRRRHTVRSTACMKRRSASALFFQSLASSNRHSGANGGSAADAEVAEGASVAPPEASVV